MPIQIRRYQEQDKEAIYYLHRLGLQAENADAGTGEWDDDLADIRGQYLNDRGEFLVALSGNEIIGMGAIRGLASGRGEIKRMRVEPAYQRRGIGTAILTRLEERAVALGYRILALDTTERQTGAQRFYNKHGYAEVNRGKLAGFSCIFYEKVCNPV